MSQFFTKTHEWARKDGDDIVIGLSRFAADEIGDVIHIELPKVGAEARRGSPLAEIESVKSVNEYYSPVDGTVAAVNQQLEDEPEAVNKDPDGAWFARITPSGDTPFDGLLDQDAYHKHVDQQ